MTTLTRTEFLQEMSNKQISLVEAKREPRLAAFSWAGVDANNNGTISGTDMELLFKALDRLDSNGDSQSVNLGSSTQPTMVGRAMAALRELAKPIAAPVPATTTPAPTPATTAPMPAPSPATLGVLQDKALANGFPNGLRTELKRGANGNAVVAVQFALGRLGYLKDLCDGAFGGNTERALTAFQSQRGLPATGSVNIQTLKLLDQLVANIDLRTPAAKAADPLLYLSSFRQLGLPVISIRGTAEIYSWASAEIQAAYGKFVGDYWEVMKSNEVEGDCKNLALFFMDQFRKQLREDRMIQLPHPVLKTAAAEKRWIVATTDKTQGLFTRADRLKRTTGVTVERMGYETILKVQALDPNQSMLYGVNVHYPEISANRVAKAAVRLFDWNPAYDNRGNSAVPEVPVNLLQAGHLIFIDHTGDGTFDHTVTVVKVEKDTAGRARKLILAVGSYDDVRDNSAATSVEGTGFSIVNTYAEEVTVTLDERGRVTASEVTYSSEPTYLVSTRYNARTTLMEQKAGGKLIVGRWG
ncbi:peptidoglycan-binding domain-containing protein [Thiofilum flexile]|uniref:peptidoglycan-binding domain-containing protein n=1 Tax=Thiofilum flexile TaxID=125627 RepID=UPI000376E753|nr:peptidoglycan-binding domain-containing protein [Thiofilum flexile]